MRSLLCNNVYAVVFFVIEIQHIGPIIYLVQTTRPEEPGPLAGHCPLTTMLQYNVMQCNLDTTKQSLNSETIGLTLIL